MALINIDNALREATRLISKCEFGSGVELMSYKRNRSIGLIRQSETTVVIIEKGYIEERQTIELAKLAKNMKTRIAREFPRSRKVRFHRVSSVAELDRVKQKI